MNRSERYALETGTLSPFVRSHVRAMVYHNAQASAFLACIHAEIRPSLERMIATSDLMDRLASGRYDGAISKGKGYGPNAFNYVEGYSVGSAELPVEFTSQAQREVIASVETLDLGTSYTLPPL